VEAGFEFQQAFDEECRIKWKTIQSTPKYFVKNILQNKFLFHVNISFIFIEFALYPDGKDANKLYLYFNIKGDLYQHKGRYKKFVK